MQLFAKFLGTITDKLSELTGGQGPLLIMRAGQLLANSEIMTRAGTVRDESMVVARHLREALVELNLVAPGVDVERLGIFQILSALFGRWLELAGIRPAQAPDDEPDTESVITDLEDELDRRPPGPYGGGEDDDKPIESSFREVD